MNLNIAIILLMTIILGFVSGNPIDHAIDITNQTDIVCHSNESLNPKTNLCIPFPELDGECDPDFDLCDQYANAFCDQKINRCVLNMPEDGYCENNGHICNKQKNMVCKDNICRSETIQINCQGDDSCANGLICHPETFTCRNYLSIGDICSTSVDLCDKRDGLFCDRKFSFCVRYLNENEVCTPEQEICRPGLYCHSTLHRCFNLVSFLGICDETSLCDHSLNLSCNPETKRCEGDVKTIKTCQDNEKCDKEHFCYENECIRYFELGNKCEIDDDQCNPWKGLYCSHEEKVCKLGLELGMECELDNDRCVKTKNLACHETFKICL